MSQPMPVHLELPDHDAIECDLDRQLGLAPRVQRELRDRRWDCLAGEAPVHCGHHRISRVEDAGLIEVVCLTCGHEWRTAS
jgi:hypothetical protein